MRSKSNDLKPGSERVGALKLNKRLLSTYFILYFSFGQRTFNIGEALDTLTVFSSKKIAIKDVKRLWKMGFLEKMNKYSFKVLKPEEAFVKYLLKYMASRISKRMKSMGIESEVRAVENKLIVKLKKPLSFPSSQLIAFEKL